jgi:DnaJ domain/PilZ domain
MLASAGADNNEEIYMPSTTSAERRRCPRRKRFQAQQPVKVRLDCGGSSEEWDAHVSDVSEAGLGIELPVPLPVCAMVRVTGMLDTGITKKPLQARTARVTRCEEIGGGYGVGLVFADGNERPQPAQATVSEPAPDYYDVMQLSPKADPDTIHRVYRLLAQRHHPDNQETGDPAQFKLLLEAYRVLSDPERRAAYDATLARARELRWKIFDSAESAHGTEAERRKRTGILSILYAQRLNQPSQPGLTIQEMEDLLGCPREHLEFSLWYLKETGCLTRTDNGRYAITVKGVDQAESQNLVPMPNNRLLPAAQR